MGPTPAHSLLRPPTENSLEPRPNVVNKGFHRWFGFATPKVRVVMESILLLLAVAGVTIWFYAPYFVRDYINRGFAGLPDYTGRVEWVRIHPLTASIDVYDFHIDKKGGDVPVHFFYSPRWNVSLQWSEIFRGVTRASVSIFDPQVNLVNGPGDGQSQEGISGVWLDAIRALIPWRVNRLYIHNGDAPFPGLSCRSQGRSRVQPPRVCRGKHEQRREAGDTVACNHQDYRQPSPDRLLRDGPCGKFR